MTTIQVSSWDEHSTRVTIEEIDSQTASLDEPGKDDNKKRSSIDEKEFGSSTSNPKFKSTQNREQFGKVGLCLQSCLPSSIDDSNKFTKFKSCSNSDVPLLIIGAGQMRTGTTSLKQALEILYQKPCYHMSRVAYELKQPHIRKWIHAFRKTDNLQFGQEFESILPREFWNSIFEGFVAAVDYPTCAFYKDLMKIYPQAKVILTVRDPDSWVSSCRATTASNLVMRKPTVCEHLINLVRGIQGLPELHHRMFKRALGKGYAKFTDEVLKQKLIDWNDQVIRSVPPDRLLIYDVRKGWDPLCKFLELPTPDPSVKFPHLNKRNDMIHVLKKYRNIEHVLEVGMIFVLFSVVFMLCYFLYIFY